jgi:IS30 family transposase
VDDNKIPISIFNSSISCLEALSLYLKEEKQKSVKEIAHLLNRKLTTIYTSLQNAKKRKNKLDLSGNVFVPIKVFSKRKFSVLESLVHHLKNNKKFSLIQISNLLGKSYSTIKTVHWRYKKK